MKVLFLFLILLGLDSSFAVSEEKNKVYVQTFDENADTSALKDPRYSVKKGLEAEHNFHDDLPSPQRQKELIRQAGLESDVASMDQLDLDVLCMNLRRHPVDVVLKKYPRLNKEKLQSFKNLLPGEKK